ncbi:hypothetical protein LCGC14_1900600, partial [marine sediment metagenome]
MSSLYELLARDRRRTRRYNVRPRRVKKKKKDLLAEFTRARFEMPAQTRTTSKPFSFKKEHPLDSVLSMFSSKSTTPYTTKSVSEPNYKNLAPPAKKKKSSALENSIKYAKDTGLGLTKGLFYDLPKAVTRDLGKEYQKKSYDESGLGAVAPLLNVGGKYGKVIGSEIAKGLGETGRQLIPGADTIVSGIKDKKLALPYERLTKKTAENPLGNIVDRALDVFIASGGVKAATKAGKASKAAKIVSPTKAVSTKGEIAKVVKQGKKAEEVTLFPREMKDMPKISNILGTPDYLTSSVFKKVYPREAQLQHRVKEAASRIVPELNKMKENSVISKTLGKTLAKESEIRLTDKQRKLVTGLRKDEKLLSSEQKKVLKTLKKDSRSVAKGYLKKNSQGKKRGLLYNDNKLAAALKEQGIRELGIEEILTQARASQNLIQAMDPVTNYEPIVIPSEYPIVICMASCIHMGGRYT